MDNEKSSRSRLKSTLLTLLQAGAGSLVLATTALMAPPAVTAATSSPDSLFKRAEGARAELVKVLSDAELTGEKPVRLAFWGNSWPNGWNNWGNFSRPSWPNSWPNWPNWRNS